MSYPGIGVFTEADNQGRTFVTGAIEGAPAHAGRRSASATKSCRRTIARSARSTRFAARSESPVSLQIRRASGAAPIAISVTPADLHPNEMFLRGLKASARVIVAGQGANWLRACLVLCEPQDSVRARGPDRRGPLKDADALVWDLRGGWGGAQPQYLDLFNPRAPTMQITDRNGETGFVDVKWRKPVAMLINEGTRSGKEVLAYGFKEYRLGELVGHRTEGAVLAATAFLIGDDGLLLLAVEDVLVDGKRLEGVGVEPTIEVPFDWRYAAGARPAARPRRAGAGAAGLSRLSDAIVRRIALEKNGAVFERGPITPTLIPRAAGSSRLALPSARPGRAPCCAGPERRLRLRRGQRQGGRLRGGFRLLRQDQGVAHRRDLSAASPPPRPSRPGSAGRR